MTIGRVIAGTGGTSEAGLVTPLRTQPSPSDGKEFAGRVYHRTKALQQPAGGRNLEYGAATVFPRGRRLRSSEKPELPHGTTRPGSNLVLDGEKAGSFDRRRLAREPTKPDPRGDDAAWENGGSTVLQVTHPTPGFYFPIALTLAGSARGQGSM